MSHDKFFLFHRCRLCDAQFNPSTCSQERLPWMRQDRLKYLLGGAYAELWEVLPEANHKCTGGAGLSSYVTLINNIWNLAWSVHVRESTSSIGYRSAYVVRPHWSVTLCIFKCSIVPRKSFNSESYKINKKKFIFLMNSEQWLWNSFTLYSRDDSPEYFNGLVQTYTLYHNKLKVLFGDPHFLHWK